MKMKRTRQGVTIQLTNAEFVLLRKCVRQDHIPREVEAEEVSPLGEAMLEFEIQNGLTAE